MTAKTSPDLRFWLLLGESPSGPYSVGQIHDRLASGDITWHTPACVLGGKAWHPLTQTPGIGPVAVDQVEGFVGSKAGESASGETSVARNAETSLPLNNPLPDSTTTSSHDVPNSARIKPVPTLIGSGPSTVMIEGQYSFAVVPPVHSDIPGGDLAERRSILDIRGRGGVRGGNSARGVYSEDSAIVKASKSTTCSASEGLIGSGSHGVYS